MKILSGQIPENILRRMPSEEQKRYGYKPDRVLSGAELEQTVRDASVGSTPRKESDTTRRRVCITSFRKRLIDPDNLCPKYFIDALRYNGIIDDDTAKHIVLEVRQEKSDDPRTEIEITPI